MTKTQFDAIAQLIRLRDVRANRAAQAVLIDGVMQISAAVEFGVSRQAVNATVRRVRKALVLCELATK